MRRITDAQTNGERKRVCSIYLFVVFFNILRIEGLVVTRREERTARERERVSFKYASHVMAVEL